jgi:CRISP-associated protein Cas1
MVKQKAPMQGAQILRNECGAVLVDDDTRKTVLVVYQKRMQDEIMHPFLNERTLNQEGPLIV